ncbi:MAG: hypothetical protein E7329_01075 [Clostridiales bacterium]|nr:hypothetical protein [Clostridiales bacterium]
MMYRSSQKVHFNAADTRLQRRVLLITCAVLLIAAIVLGVLAASSGAYRSRAEIQFSQRMQGAVSSAIEEVNRMAGMVTSNTTARLAKVRQYVYYMEQLNAVSMALAGGEMGRLAPDDAFTALYNDLDTFESIAQQATTSTLDARTQLLNHLTLLQGILVGQ